MLAWLTPSRAVLAAAALAVALAGFLWLRLDAARARADAAEERAARAVARAGELQDALRIQTAAEQRARAVAAAAQAAARDARARWDDLRARVDAAPDADDGAVAPVLNDALNSLRRRG